MLPFAAAFLAHEAKSAAAELYGPLVHNSISNFRLAAGWNDMARNRLLQYDQNRQSTFRQTLSDNWTPVRLGFGQALDLFNMSAWTRADTDNELRLALWNNLKDNLRNCGVELGTQQVDGVVQGEAAPDTTLAKNWYHLCHMSSSAAPLDYVVRDWYRSGPLDAALRTCNDAELAYNFQRGKFRRKEDRNRLLGAFYHWNPSDALQLQWLGAFPDNAVYTSLLNAAGVVQGIDAEYFDLLSRRRIDAKTLAEWANRNLWDEDLADRFGLDDGFDQSPIAQFFAKAQGWGVDQSALRNQPEGEANWLKLMYRNISAVAGHREAIEMQRRLRPLHEGEGGASIVEGVMQWTEEDTRKALAAHGIPDKLADRLMGIVDPLISIGEAFQMQRRFRPTDDPEASTIPGVSPWTEDDTRGVLADHGYTGDKADYLMGLVEEPVNIRIINHILTEQYRNPAIDAYAKEVFGEENWVKGAFLSHGYNDVMADIAAQSVIATAKWRADAKLHQNQDRQEEEGRKLAIAEYNAGLVDVETAARAMTDDNYTFRMALDQLIMEDRQQRLEMVGRQVDVLKKAWLKGTFSAPVVNTALAGLGINAVRRTILLREWTWERTEEIITLSTGEVLAAFKKGFMNEAGAIARLLNLGWSKPDALLEIAIVEKEVATEQAKEAVREMDKKTAEAAKAAKERAKQILDAAKEATRTATEIRKATYEQLVAIHEKLLQQSEYYAKQHKLNVAYENAAAKNKTEDMAAILEESVAAYQRWLSQQLKLASISPGVEHVVAPINVIPAPQPDQSAGGPGEAGATADAAGSAEPALNAGNPQAGA